MFAIKTSIAQVFLSEDVRLSFRPDFTSKLEHRLAFGTPKFYIAPYGKINHALFNLSYNCNVKSGLRPDFTSKLVHVLAFGTPKFYIAPYDKIKHKLVNLSSNCDVKSGLSLQNLVSPWYFFHYAVSHMS